MSKKTKKKSIKTKSTQQPKNSKKKAAESSCPQNQEIKKIEYPSGPQKMQDLGPAPIVKTAKNSYGLQGIFAVCLFMIGYTFVFGALANTIDANSKDIIETTTLETTTAITTSVETTTEVTQLVVTQAPEVKYTRSAAATHVNTNNVVKLSVPYVSQLPTYPTGCEAASITMLLRFWGYSYSLDTVVNTMPSGLIHKVNGKAYGPSIYEKFVGDPRQNYSDSSPGYGAFAPVVTRTLNALLDTRKHVAKNITGSSLATLFSYIDKGYPVIVWSTYNMIQPKTANKWYIEGTDEYFEYPRGTHVTVLTGYDNSNVYMQDPLYSGGRRFTQEAFSSKYNLLWQQAVVVLPTEALTTTTTEVITSENETEDTTGEDIADENTTDVSDFETSTKEVKEKSENE